MDISNLPTDNLYKFMAIFGLIIYVITYFYPGFLIDEQEIRLAELENEKYNVETRLLIQQHWLQGIGEMVDSAKDPISLQKLSELNLAEKSRLDTITNEILKIGKDASVALTKLKHIRSIITQSAWIGSIAGFFMILGFFLWYFKLQRYQDMIIKNEAMKIKNAIKKNKTDSV